MMNSRKQALFVSFVFLYFLHEFDERALRNTHTTYSIFIFAFLFLDFSLLSLPMWINQTVPRELDYTR